MKPVFTSIGVAIFLVGTSLAVETPFTPFKDGFATVSTASGVTRTLEVQAGSSKAWVVHPLSDGSTDGALKARLSVYVKDIGRDGTLRVYLANPFRTPEANTQLSALKSADSVGAVALKANDHIQGMVSIQLGAAFLKALKDGTYGGLILEGADGLDAELGAIEGGHGALLYLDFPVGSPLGNVVIDSLAATVVAKYGDQLKGADGLRGADGAKGDKGDKGDTGLAGAQGPKGDKGDKGDIGLSGPQGEKGDKGDKGDPGSVGPQGIQGMPGDRGRSFQILADRGFRARYDFNAFAGNNPTTTPDGSSFGNNLTLSGGGITKSPVTPGDTVAKDTCVFLDGISGYLVAPHDESLAPYGEISLSARVNISVSAPETNTVVSKKNMYELAVIHGTRNQIRARFKTVLADWQWVGSTVDFANETWVNIRATYDGNGIRTFLNGTQIHFQAFPNGPLAMDTTTSLYLGTREPSIRGFKGNLDQVQILATAVGGVETRNIVRFQASTGMNSDLDSGYLPGRTVTLYKRDSATSIRVMWTDNFRVATLSQGCRWEIMFDSASCVSPSPLRYDKYEGSTSSNRHDPNTVMGACLLRKTGNVVISAKVGRQPAYPAGVNCYTGWSDQTVYLEAEEVP